MIQLILNSTHSHNKHATWKKKIPPLSWLSYFPIKMDSQEPRDSSLTSSSRLSTKSAAPPIPPPRRTQGSFIEEDSLPPALPPRLVELPATPPVVSTSNNNSNYVSSAPPPTPTRPMNSELTHRKKKAGEIADLVPDLHGISPARGLSTELNTHDAVQTLETVAAAEQKSVPATTALSVGMPGGFVPPTKSRIPEWYRTGWTSFATGVNPGGELDILASRFKGNLNDPLDEIMPDFLYGEWYHNGAALFATAIVSFVLAKMNAGLGSILLFCLFIGKQKIYAILYYSTFFHTQHCY